MSYSYNKKRKFIKWLKKEMGKKDWLKIYSDCFKKQKRD